MKLCYCAQGDRTMNVGVVDSEYIVHQGIQTLGISGRKGTNAENATKHLSPSGVDTRVKIRRQSTWELSVFKDRWNKAVNVDPLPKEAATDDARRRHRRA